MDLVDLLKHPEGKTLEFKRDISSPDGALKTIIAFANTAGGTLLIGVEDKSGHVRGVTQPLDLEEGLANLISDHVAPRLVPEIEILPCAPRFWPSGSTRARAARTISSARGSTAPSTSGWAPPTAEPTASWSRSFAASAAGRRSTSSRCRISTRKRWTSEPLPSRLRPFER